MGQTVIALNGNEETRPCQAALNVPLEGHSLSSSSQMLFDLAGARGDDRFVFCSSGAEAVNQVLWSVFLEVARKEGKCHFIASALEDAPTMQMMKRLEELGCFVKIIPVNERGQIDLETFKESISPRTALVSIGMAQGLTGVIQPVEEIAALSKEKGVLLHLEGSYAMGKYYFSFGDLGADYLTFSGHLLHSVTGSGGLFAKKEAPLVPLILGGKGFRGGPIDTSSFLSLCFAAQQASFFLDNMSLETARLRDLLEREIKKEVPEAIPLFTKELRLPNTSAILFPRVHQEALQFLLEKQVKTSVGGSYAQHLERLLSASGIAGGDTALSFGLSRMTTEQEVIFAAQTIGRAVQTLQSISQGVFDAAE